jgi:hypothetical protein
LSSSSQAGGGDLRAAKVAMLIQDTHRLVTNSVTDRVNDLRRVSREAMRFGRQTNHSDADVHVSTIRPSLGQSQRVACFSAVILHFLERRT